MRILLFCGVVVGIGYGGAVIAAAVLGPALLTTALLLLLIGAAGRIRE
jgi:hypothetical protein